MGLANVGLFLSLVSGLGYSLEAFLGLYDLYGIYDLLTLIDLAGGVTNYAFPMRVCPILGLAFGSLNALMLNLIALPSGLSADQGWALE